VSDHEWPPQAMRTLPADGALDQWNRPGVFAGGPRPVIHCTGTFSSLRCAQATT